MADITNINSISETYRKSHVEKIIGEAASRTKKLSKLAYLFSAWQEEKEALYPRTEICRTSLKSAILDNYEMDQLSEYFSETTKGEIHRNFVTTLNRWEANKKYREDGSGLSPNEFINKNRSVIPAEIAELIKLKGSKVITTADEDNLSGIILGMLHVVNDLEDLIEKTINDDKIGQEEWKEIKSLLDNKIHWSGKLNEFAFFMNRLFNNSIIEIPEGGSAPKKADLLYAHFKIDGHDKKDATKRSLKDAINNSETSPNTFEKFKNIFR